MRTALSSARIFLIVLLCLVHQAFSRVRENPNGGGFQVFESTKFFEFTNATEFLFEWVNSVGNGVNQGPLYEEAQDFGGGIVCVSAQSALYMCNKLAGMAGVFGHLFRISCSRLTFGGCTLQSC
jgi:hypothetical protein